MERFDDIIGAVERSRSHNEIVRVDVSSKHEALQKLEDTYAFTGVFVVNSVDLGEGEPMDVWGYFSDTSEPVTEWRLALREIEP